MNPMFIKVGVGVAFAAFAFFAMYWSQNRQNHSRPFNPRPTGNYDGSNQSHCTICLQELGLFSTDVVRLSCKHKFHKTCIRDVFRQECQKSCPLCRQKIPDAEARLFVTESPKPAKRRGAAEFEGENRDTPGQ